MVMEKIGYMNIFDNIGHTELYQSSIDKSVYFKIGTTFVKFSEFNLKVYKIFGEP